MNEHIIIILHLSSSRMFLSFFGSQLHFQTPNEKYILFLTIPTSPPRQPLPILQRLFSSSGSITAMGGNILPPSSARSLPTPRTS
uniref:Uncharacterized protein n=1 Tax=Daphnia magna TaxID=35525 RepID=A0A0N8EPJ6_9CRUS